MTGLTKAAAEAIVSKYSWTLRIDQSWEGRQYVAIVPTEERATVQRAVSVLCGGTGWREDVPVEMAKTHVYVTTPAHCVEAAEDSVKALFAPKAATALTLTPDIKAFAERFGGDDQIGQPATAKPGGHLGA